MSPPPERFNPLPTQRVPPLNYFEYLFLVKDPTYIYFWLKHKTVCLNLFWETSALEKILDPPLIQVFALCDENGVFINENRAFYSQDSAVLIKKIKAVIADWDILTWSILMLT